MELTLCVLIRCICSPQWKLGKASLLKSNTPFCAVARGMLFSWAMWLNGVHRCSPMVQVSFLKAHPRSSGPTHSGNVMPVPRSFAWAAERGDARPAIVPRKS